MIFRFNNDWWTQGEKWLDWPSSHLQIGSHALACAKHMTHGCTMSTHIWHHGALSLHSLQVTLLIFEQEKFPQTMLLLHGLWWKTKELWSLHLPSLPWCQYHQWDDSWGPGDEQPLSWGHLVITTSWRWLGNSQPSYQVIALWQVSRSCQQV